MLSQLKDWDPFRLDALGLVTMIGADEMQMAVGTLTTNRFLEYIPLLGAFTVSSDLIVRNISGFAIYNITDAIYATDVAGWFCRWLLAQNLSWNKTTIICSVAHRKAKRRVTGLSAISTGLLVNIAVLSIAIVMRDMFGVANAVSMIASVAVRCIIVSQNRSALDREAVRGTKRGGEIVKTFCILSDGKAFTFHVPRDVLLNCFLTTPVPPNPRLYLYARTFGWLAFAVHVVSIGMAALLNQIVTVIILVVGTVATVYGIGNVENCVGNRLLFKLVEREDKCDTRVLAYVDLNLSREEEETMTVWSLFPQKSNVAWWARYREFQAKREDSRDAQDFGFVDWGRELEEV